MSEPNEHTEQIRAINDRLRRSFQNVTVTPGILDEGEAFFLQLVQKVVTYDRWEEGNDPYGEHDFGAVCIDGTKCYWKFSYFEKGSNFMAGAETPWDETTTDRVLTIMLAADY